VPDLRVLGLDQSLTSSGLALASSLGEIELDRIQVKARGHERMAGIEAEVISWADPSRCDVVVMEGLSFGAKGNALLDLAGLSWIIRQRLWERGMPYVIIPPALRAKYITGNGAAGKDLCLTAAAQRFAPVLPGYGDPDAPPALDGNDKADALTLCQMGRDYYGCPLVRVPADRTALLRSVHTEKNRTGQPKIMWPQITRERGAGHVQPGEVVGHAAG